MASRILVVDAEPHGWNAYKEVLSRQGFHVLFGRTGHEAITAASKEKPDLMIVNLQLPDMAGHELCQKIRQTADAHRISLLVVSGDHVDGLPARCFNSGADGYLVKPIDGKDLVANIHAILRRPKIYLSDQDVIGADRLKIRPGERRVLFDEKDILNLTPKEYELLKELLIHAPRVVGRDDLVLKVWNVPFEQLGRRSLDVHIQRLRRKLGPDAAPFLKTITLVGYQWLESTHL